MFYKAYDTGGYYIEQLYLIPIVYEPMDRCGWRVAVSGQWALVGCPNRDLTALPNHNTGDGIMYNLNLLGIEFSNTTYEVVEGASVNVTVQRSATTALPGDVFFNISTVDRNSPATVQSFFESLFGLTDPMLTYPMTVIDFVGVGGKAFGRSQYYGSTHNESAWIDGQYDYRAVSDYVPINNPQAYLATDLDVIDTIVTTLDHILEKPDEVVTIGIHAPGLWPTVLGRLYAYLTILDHGDGLASLDPLQLSTSEQLLQYDKLYDDFKVGFSLAVSEDIGTMCSGSPLVTVDGVSEAGQAMLYYKLGQEWVKYDTLTSPNGPSALGHYGHEVVMSSITKLNASYLIIGEPGASLVHIYRSGSKMANTSYPSWALDLSIPCPTGHLPQNLFGSQGTIAIADGVLVLGSPTLEIIYLYYSVYSVQTNTFSWVFKQALQSSDFNYDIVYGQIQPHRQRFGTSVAISQRTIAVGAPFADYDPIGVDAVELNWNSEGTDIFATGKGKVYIFYSPPAQALITLHAAGRLSQGTFRLQYNQYGLNQTTAQLPFSADGTQMANALMALLNIDSVLVHMTSSIAATSTVFQWSVTFLSSYQTPGALQPIWYNNSCSDCTPFNANHTSITTQSVSTQGPFNEQTTLSADDKQYGDRFGSSLALDGDQLMVGAIYSNGIATTTWDFEVGTLEGWSKTGNAFDYQPTYLDNTRYREVYAGTRNFDPNGQGAHSRLVGNYFIGTYEMRPGDPAYYQDGDPNFSQGSVQGDGPIGTLTSDVFSILGSKISFLIGGGCDYYLEYVELLVDGISMDKATGRCAERMDPTLFDVSKYYGHSGQIRIVDNSHANWGHINVDNFQFDWDIQGARHNNTNVIASTIGKVETPLSGAVYAFLRTAPDGINLCVDVSSCIWQQEAKLSPSDKHAQHGFGQKIHVNFNQGVAYISAPNSRCYGFYKELQTVYPYIDAAGNDITAGLNYPISMRDMRLFEAYSTLAIQASGASGILKLLNATGASPDPRVSYECGAVYIFIKDFPTLSNTGAVLLPQHWHNSESMKLQPSDAYAYDNFGASMALSGNLLAVGSPGQDGFILDGGALYTFNAAFSTLAFTAVSSI